MKIVKEKEARLVPLFGIELGDIFKIENTYWMKCDEDGGVVTAVNMESGEITDNFYVATEVQLVNAEIRILD